MKKNKRTCSRDGCKAPERCKATDRDSTFHLRKTKFQSFDKYLSVSPVKCMERDFFFNNLALFWFDIK